MYSKAWTARGPGPWGALQRRVIHQGSSGWAAGRQAQSPMMTSGASSCRSSAAETGPVLGPVLGWLSFCRRRPSLELDGGKRGIEEPLAVMTSGTSCCSSSSMPSCSASCRFTAMAWPAKKVRPRALLVLRRRRPSGQRGEETTLENRRHQQQE